MCVYVYIMYLCTYMCTHTPYMVTEYHRKETSRSTDEIFKGIPSNLMYSNYSIERKGLMQVEHMQGKRDDDCKIYSGYS